LNYWSMRVDGAATIVGTQDFHRKLPPNFRALLAVSSDDELELFTSRCLGEKCSARGSFTFEQDATTKWMSRAHHDSYGAEEQTSAIRWAQKRFGSVKLDAFALFFSQEEFVGFWIEASEGDRKRVFASEKTAKGVFEGLPEDFHFTTSWIADLVTGQF
jgi:hypothetical protein